MLDFSDEFKRILAIILVLVALLAAAYITLTLLENFIISGTVVDASGQPVPNAVVVASINGDVIGQAISSESSPDSAMYKIECKNNVGLTSSFPGASIEVEPGTLVIGMPKTSYINGSSIVIAASHEPVTNLTPCPADANNQSRYVKIAAMVLLVAIAVVLTVQTGRSPTFSDSGGGYRKVASTTPYKYEIAISCAGEDTALVNQIVKCLERRGIRTFYYLKEADQVDLLGKNIADRLAEIYLREAEYCVIFHSKDYSEKVWTNYERHLVISRTIEQKEKEYVLLIRLDDEELPGILATIGYIDAKRTSAKNICELLRKKITGT